MGPQGCVGEWGGTLGLQQSSQSAGLSVCRCFSSSVQLTDGLSVQYSLF